MESRIVLTNPKPGAISPGTAPATTALPATHTVPEPRKLDLSGMAPPMKLSEARLEDLTIDGICGVY